MFVILICGKRVCLEVIKNKQKIDKAYLSFDFSDQKVITYLQKNKIKIKFLTKIELNKIEKRNHQGIILDIPEYQYYNFKCLLEEINNTSFILILDHIEDPHNLGAIIRTCEGAGIDAIIIPKNRSAEVNETVMKVSAGAANILRICQVSNLNEAIRKLKAHGCWIVGSDIKTDVLYNEGNYNFPLVLIVGNEGKGISILTQQMCDFMVKIPLHGKIESLNVAVATGILLYKINEQRGGSNENL